MAYDEELAERVRGHLGSHDVVEQRMFGGLAFLVGGHLAVAASSQGGLMLRCEPAQTAALLQRPGAAPMVMRGREVDGWLRVDAAAVAEEAALAQWVEVGTTYAAGLPPQAR